MSENSPPCGVIFEISWEVGNMVGGIHTVVASKVAFMQETYGDDYVVIGPDLWKEDAPHPDFIEDCFSREWLSALEANGFSVRMGRWDVPGKPKCLLVDFSKYYQNKDDVLKWLWEHFKVDSLFGGWDYVEPVLFGYAVGQLIECLVINHKLPQGKPTLTHWHEWMVGSGLLYLEKKVPEVATVFTTHATILGRSLSGTGVKIPNDLDETEASQKAHSLGISAKHSLEKVTSQECDCLTTVSEVTAHEVDLFHKRKPDVLLPNALGDEFPHPMYEELDSISSSRVALFNLAELLTAEHFDRDNTFLFASSGRYEYINKGANLVVDSLADLRDFLKQKEKQVILFMLFPAGIVGLDREILEAQNKGTSVSYPKICTHELREPQNDPLLKHLKKYEIQNKENDAIKVIFIPIYLDGRDTLVARTYFELLGAFDLTLYPSYYEPWGYTPLESLRYGVPTVTSDLAGFGKWVASLNTQTSMASYVLPRAGVSYEDSRKYLAQHMKKFVAMDLQSTQQVKNESKQISQIAQWGNFGSFYLKAHNFALEKSCQKHHGVIQKVQKETAIDDQEAFKISNLPQTDKSFPSLNFFTVKSHLPKSLQKMRVLAQNLWWSWSPNIKDVFKEIDPVLWGASGRNPVKLLEMIPQDLLDKKSKDLDFLIKIEESLESLDHYLDERKNLSQQAQVAYFCMEFGLHECLPFYSGGLGILAGDHLKTASDDKIPLVGIGLAFRRGYFQQKIDKQGEQYEESLYLDFNAMPLEPVLNSEGKRLVIYVRFPGRGVAVQVWKVQVGAVNLFLLDTDHERNRPNDKQITSTLYGGDQETRLKQEIILGLGGLKVLKALGISPQMYHLNEGHASFVVLGRIAKLIYENNLSYQEASEFCRQTTLFTTHTPVPAGHDVFSEDLMRPYFSHFDNLLGKSWNHIMDLGKISDGNSKEDFSMTVLAIKGSGQINSVSKIHKKVSQDMFQPLLPGYPKFEFPMESITNGIHLRTWLAPRFIRFFQTMSSAQVDQVSDLDFFKVKSSLKKDLLENIKNRLKVSWHSHHNSPTLLAKTLQKIDDSALIVGFARRFVTYKRPQILFRDLNRLAKIVSQKNRPILFVFAGKAHPQDVLSKKLIRDIFSIAHQDEFLGRVIFLEDYNFNLARHLVQGCDIWLNTPIRPLEASGTSGMKAALNGGVNLSVLDGWWAEAHAQNNGWAIGENEAHLEIQDDLDSDHLYALLEYEIIPSYFDVNEHGFSESWVKRAKQSMLTVWDQFSSNRMLSQYNQYFYVPTANRYHQLSENHFKKIKNICAAKDHLRKAWDQIKIEDVDIGGLSKSPIYNGQSIPISAQVNHPNLDCDQIKVEFVVGQETASNEIEPETVISLRLNEKKEGTCTWNGVYTPQKSGSRVFGFRVVPHYWYLDQSVDLDLGLVTWV